MDMAKKDTQEISILKWGSRISTWMVPSFEVFWGKMETIKPIHKILEILDAKHEVKQEQRQKGNRNDDNNAM